MANLLDANPLVLDTANSAAIWTDPLYITHISWVSKSAAQDDECLIEDQSGNKIFDSFATGADWEDARSFNREYHVNGLILKTLTSGAVYIHYR